MEVGILSMRYAKAIIEYAQEKGLEDRLYQEFLTLSHSFCEQPGLREALDNPVITTKEKLALVCTAADGDGKSTREFVRFITLVLRNRREGYLQFISLMYLDLYRKLKHIGTGKLITAVPVDAKTFFTEQYFPLFFDHEKYMQWVTNSPFVQGIKKGKCLTAVERREKLRILQEKIERDEADASIAIGFPSLDSTATTSGQITNLKLPVSSEDVYLSWIGSGFGVGVQGGLSILFEQEQILMALFEGWRIYREYLERMQGLRGNQINTWNGQWLAHYFSDHFIEDEPLIGFQPFAAKEDGYEVVTRSWTDVLMAIAREIKDVRMMGYVYSLGQTNITVGFIPFVLTEIRRTVELYIKLFGMRNAKKAEHLFGTAYGFLRSCQMGMIGVSALEPKGLKEYMMKGKIPVYDAENEEKRINFYTYIIWILAMLNNEDLREKSREIAQMLHTYVLGDKKSNMTRRNQVNKILETNSRMIFLNELQQIIPQIPDIKFAEDIGKLIHSMPVDNIPYFLTLVLFNYAIVCNQ